MTGYQTEQRKMLQLLFEQHPHELFSANDIAELIGDDTISISAVYRNLAQLENEGLVRRSVRHGSRQAFYQYVATDSCREHIHLTCKKCGKTIHMEDADTNAITTSAAKYKDFEVDRGETVLIGLCGSCRGK